VPLTDSQGLACLVHALIVAAAASLLLTLSSLGVDFLT
jgi:hypothetical protein